MTTAGYQYIWIACLILAKGSSLVTTGYEPWKREDCLVEDNAEFRCTSTPGNITSADCLWKDRGTGNRKERPTMKCSDKNSFKLPGSDKEFSLFTDQEEELTHNSTNFVVDKAIVFIRNETSLNDPFLCLQRSTDPTSPGGQARQSSFVKFNSAKLKGISGPIVVLTGCFTFNETDKYVPREFRENNIFTEYKTKLFVLSILSLAIRAPDNKAMRLNPRIVYSMDLSKENSFYEFRTKRVTDVGSSCIMQRNRTWNITGCAVESRSDQRLINCSCVGVGLYSARNSITVHHLHNEHIVSVSKILVVLSSVFLIITAVLLITYRKKLQKDRTWIQIGATVSFFLQNCAAILTFVTHDISPGLTGLCEAAAILNSYFTASTSLWMLNEGILLFTKIYLVDESQYRHTQGRNRIVALGANAWLVPVILVAVIGTIAFKNERFLPVSKLYTLMQEWKSDPRELSQYRKYVMCWTIRGDYVTIITALPIVVSFCFNLFVTICTAVTVWRKNASANATIYSDASHSKAKMRRSNTIATMNAIFLLLIGLGTPYLISLCLCMFKMNLQAVVAHLMLTSTHGPLVFYAYCYRNTKLREALKRSCKRRKMEKVNA